jgi:phosphate transport system permease protein
MTMPQKPWKKSAGLRLLDGLFIVLGLVVAGLIVSASPMAGPEAVGFVAIPVIAIINFLRVFRQGTTARMNALATTFIMSAFLFLITPWLSVMGTVASRGRGAVYSGFFTNDMRITPPKAALDMGGIKHAIIGTAIMVLIASIISVPLGILSGVYVTEIRGRFTGLVRFITQAMSGVPSIVAGLFVYSTYVLFFGSYSGFAGAISLAILMIPTVARTSEEVLKLVSEDLRFAGYALGSTQSRNVFKVVLPTVRSGLVTSAVLGVARVAGETAPLLMTAQYFIASKTNPFDGPIASLPAYIFNMFQTGNRNSVDRAWGAALVLLVLVFLLFTFARVVTSARRRK